MPITDYQPTDSFFGKPYLDADERRDLPQPHRYVHGGFEGTDTRFAIYLPDAEAYQGRFFQPLGGGLGGDEFAFGGRLGDVLGGIGMGMRLGGYVVESNQGHIGSDLDPKAGEDPSIYGYRASAETARFAKHLAARHYGAAPHHGYVYGGSGGARRSPLCLENAPDIYDGALPFMGGGPIAPGHADKPIDSVQPTGFGAMFNVKRLLREKLADVIDAVEPGGSGDPFEGLDTGQREALAALYRLGFPRGAEFMIDQPMGQAAMWTWNADVFARQDPDYTSDFWTKPGYAGFDTPDLFKGDRIIRQKVSVKEARTAGSIRDEVMAGGPAAREASAFMAVVSPPGHPIGLRLQPLPDGYLPGASIRILSGKAAGRQLYVTGVAGDTMIVDGFGADGNAKLIDVVEGDQVEVDNDAYLAYCYWYRHHIIPNEKGFDQVLVDGAPMFPQRPRITLPTPFGGSYSARFEGKLIWMQHTHDTSLWPDQAILYAEGVTKYGTPDNFRLQWVENAEHIPPSFLPASIVPAPSSRLIDYTGIIEQGLADLVAWVEKDVPPPASRHDYVGGRLILPEEADERGGIQPVVKATANGGVRAEVKRGEEVQLAFVAAMPEALGTIVKAEWDFDGTASFPVSHDDIDGQERIVARQVTHIYDKPGTYFATARIAGHRDGTVGATTRLLYNLDRVRIVVS